VRKGNHQGTRNRGPSKKTKKREKVRHSRKPLQPSRLAQKRRTNEKTQTKRGKDKENYQLPPTSRRKLRSKKRSSKFAGKSQGKGKTNLQQTITPGMFHQVKSGGQKAQEKVPGPPAKSFAEKEKNGGIHGNRLVLLNTWGGV